MHRIHYGLDIFRAGVSPIAVFHNHQASAAFGDALVESGSLLGDAVVGRVRAGAGFYEAVRNFLPPMLSGCSNALKSVVAAVNFSSWGLRAAIPLFVGTPEATLLTELPLVLSLAEPPLGLQPTRPDTAAAMLRPPRSLGCDE